MRTSESPGFCDGAKMPGARLGCPLEGLMVDVHEAEALAITSGPLEVVEQRPIEKALHVDTLVKTAADLRQRRIDVSNAAGVIVGRDSAFRHEDRPSYALRR